MVVSSIKIPAPGALSELLSFVFPVRCVHCGRSGNWLCEECARSLQALDGPVCRRCGRPGRPGPGNNPPDSCPECRGRDFPFESARAAFRYDGPARSIVHRLKYSGQRRLAGFMAAISADFLRRVTRGDRSFTLTYVPQHRSRRSTRGYNQAALYAGALARNLDLPLQGLLAKQHATPAQNRLDFGSRRNNLSGSIILKPRGAAARRPPGAVILVDDVYTTGSTAAECAGLLKEHLGVRTFIWTFARTVRSPGSAGAPPATEAAGRNRVDGLDR